MPTAQPNNKNEGYGEGKHTNIDRNSLFERFGNTVSVFNNNIKFTTEMENDGKISFLDVNVGKDYNKCFNYGVFHKPSFTGLGISYFSFVQFRFKINSIYTLLHRAYRISSSYLLFHNEVRFLSNLFIQNGFPQSLFYSCVNQFLNNKYKKSPIEKPSSDKVIYFSMPYFGEQSEILRKDILCLLSRYFSDIKFNSILTNKGTIGSLFKHKDQLPSRMRSSVIYKYCCPQCGSFYVGSSSSNL